MSLNEYYSSISSLNFSIFKAGNLTTGKSTSKFLLLVFLITNNFSRILRKCLEKFNYNFVNIINLLAFSSSFSYSSSITVSNCSFIVPHFSSLPGYQDPHMDPI